MKFSSIRSILFALAAIMAAVIAGRMLFGAFRFGSISVTVPLNPEGLFGLSVVLLLVLQTGSNKVPSSWTLWSRQAALLAVAGIAGLSFLALRRTLGLYFLSDDFILAEIGNSFDATSFRHAIGHGGGDGFFRPMGYLSLSLDAALGGFNPFVWHSIALILHAANSVLVVFLARRLGGSMFASVFAGGLFAVHGVHPEAVAWIAGRFDLLATFFLLTGLLLAWSGKDFRFRLARESAALACFALAALSKESAFVFPLLVAVYVLWNRQTLWRTIPYFALAAILFFYRWSLLGGIGGYADPATGRPLALKLGLGSTLKALGVRVWTALFFPLNWSQDPSLPLVMLAIVYLGALLWLALGSRGTAGSRMALTALLISLLPVLSLLAGSAALSGSRVLYLPSVWFAILIALSAGAMQSGSRYTAAVVVLAFQIAALQHNLGFWEAASEQVRAACAAGAPTIPDWIDGAPALANGRRECVEIARRGRATP